MSIIAARHLTYTYPRTTQPVLQDLSFDIPQGGVTALLGCSGSGKSTLLLALAGIVPEFYGGEWAGSLQIGDVTVTAKSTSSADVVAQVTVVLQVPDTQLIGFRVAETIAFGLENQGWSAGLIRQRIQTVLDELGIAHLRDRLTDSLSGGQKQACVLAAMLALDTPIMVLDEPTSALDPAGKELVGRVVARLKELGKTLVISDQNLDWFQHLVDHAVVLNPEGGLLFEGNLREFLANRSLVQRSGIPVPSLATVAYTLREQGHAADPWLTMQEAQTWIATHIDLPSGYPASARSLGESGSTRRKSNLDTESATVRCVGVTHTYLGAAYPAIAEINLTAYPGKVLGIIGQNGSGKSTAIRHLNGLLKAQKGTVTVAGQNVAKASVAQMARLVGMAFQNPDLMLFNETVEQEVLFSLKQIKPSVWKEQRELELMGLLAESGLASRKGRSPLALSVGEKQILAILCALSLDPAVLVLDEPTFGMDQRGRNQLGHALQQLRSRGKAILCVSHDLPLLAEYADDILVFRDGRIECCRPTRELLADRELFDRINIPLPAHVQLSQQFCHRVCLTPAELANLLMTVAV
ncbi:MAG TPA: ABC transporter ATP-binding protein [Crinalium sp.]|jgi:energy-coupling factor transport system ATP-binding protein